MAGIIASQDWNEFAAEVAKAVSAGEDVRVITGPETAGGYVAETSGGGMSRYAGAVEGDYGDGDDGDDDER